MDTISLITDFGLADNFVGVMKAVILKINPRADIVDICHQVNPQDITEAAFLLNGSYKYFPSGTVHLVVVDPQVGSRRKALLVKTKSYYFIAPDNGVLVLTLKQEPPSVIVEINNERYFLKPVSSTFHGRDILAPVAAYISKGIDIDRFGKRIKKIKELILPKAEVGPKILAGEVIYIDRFGNLVSNIEKDTFYRFVKDNRFQIYIKNKYVDRLSSSYCEVKSLEPLALIDSFNFLEISINGGSAADFFGANKGLKIEIKKL